eukprot:scaffold13.g319.t1
MKKPSRGFDYLLRDSTFCGFKISGDPNRIIQFSHVIGDEICFKWSEYMSLYELFHSRASMHRQVYTHKKAKAIEFMVVDALLEADRVLRISDQIWSPATFQRLDDTLLDLLENFDLLGPRVQLEEDEERALRAAQAIIARIRRRDLYKAGAAAGPAAPAATAASRMRGVPGTVDAWHRTDAALQALMRAARRAGRARKAAPTVEPRDDGEDPSCSDVGAGVEPAAKRARGDARSAAGQVSSYFLPAAAGSGRTLAELQLAAGEEETLRDILGSLPPKLGAERAAIRRELRSRMGRWWAALRAGSSLLLYGYGSKRDVLEEFRMGWTSDGGCVTVDGLLPGVTARGVLQAAAAALRRSKPQVLRSQSKEELLELVAAEAGRSKLYVIVNNLDGPGLRDAASQRLLSQLAVQPHVHLVASVDHVNFPTRDRFAWVWERAATFEPYVREVAMAAVPALLVGGREEGSKQSAGVVLASLRERFLVTSEILLKSFLQEFRDHELLATKRAADGSELLHIPLDEAVLQTVLEDLDAMS